MKKQEHKTFLSGGVIVEKTVPRVEFRGRLDSLAAAIIELQIIGQTLGKDSLALELEEILEKIHDISACEVTEKTCEELSLWGLQSDEIRERSHYPERYYGLGHIRIHYTIGPVAAGLNTLRTQVREAELSACRAFSTPQGIERPDIVEVMNRLSSAVYILIYKYLPEGYDKTIKF